MITILISLLSLGLLLGLIWLFLFCPSLRRMDFSAFDHAIIAHRGMFNEAENIPENNMQAFRRAIEHGYGIETDIHITRDDRLVVIHDHSLKRVYGADLRVEDHTLEELRAYRTILSGEELPLFSDFLRLVDGRVPLILELKGTRSEIRMLPLLKKELEGYTGPFCIESFDPYLLHETARVLPEVCRGFLSQQFTRSPNQRSFRYYVSQYLWCNFYTRPDFIAYQLDGGSSFTLRAAVKLGARPVAWTVRTAKDLEKAKPYFDCLICENLPVLFPDGSTRF